MRPARLVGSFLILAGCCGLPVLGQQWTIYDMSNTPLPSTTVKALVSDGNNGMWVGTDWGLCHFDGVDGWTVFQEGTSPLVENNISCLAMDDAGRLWIGTVAMGLQVKDGETWTTYTPLDSPLPEYGIRDLFIDGNDAVWICTSGGLARFDGSTWVEYDDTPQSHDGAILNSANTNAVAVRDDGTICLGTFNGGLHFIQGGSVEVLTSFEDGFFDNTAVEVAYHPTTGARWVATPAAGLLRQQGPVVGGVWTQWSAAFGFPSNATTSLAFDPEGDVWVGTQIAGLVEVHADGSFIQYTTTGSGLPDDNIKSLWVDADGSIWVGTFLGGLAHYEPSVGIQDRSSTNMIRAFPNPASDQVSLCLPPEMAGATWQLHSPTGAVVRQGVTNAARAAVRMDGLATGLYQLRVIAFGSVESFGIVVE